MNIVIDTCVMIAGIMGQHCEEKILKLVRDNIVTMVYSEDLLTEYLLAPTNFLLKKNRLNNHAIKNYAHQLSSTMSFFICNCAKLVKVKTDGKYLKDQSDDKLINLAIQSNAKYLISLDCHLFEDIRVKNKSGKEIIVISPYQFLQLYNLRQRFSSKTKKIIIHNR